MPLTPQDVSNKRFTPVRLREGYDMGEVDQFLDEVEAELERLLAENEDLRSKLTAHGVEAPTAAPGATEQTGDDQPTAEPPEEGARTEEEPARGRPEPGQAEQTPAAAPRQEIKVVTAAEASSAATRLLELATRNADEVVAEAREEAEQILGSARSQAEQLESETQSRTDQLEQEARTRAQNLDTETEEKRRELLGEMEQERTRLGGEIENLRAFEREYRSRLKSYFSQQLQALDGDGEAGELPEGLQDESPWPGGTGQDGAGRDGTGQDESHAPTGQDEAVKNDQE